jgi:hypothetical protein
VREDQPVIYLSLVGVVLIHVALFSKRGLLDPVSVFFLAFLYYSYFAPISMLLFGFYGLDVAGQLSWVTLATINRAAIVFLLGYAGYALAYYQFSKGDDVAHYPLRNESIALLLKDSYARILLIFVIIVITVLTTYFRRELADATESYEGKIAGNYNASAYAFVINAALTLLSLIFNYLILNVRRHLIATHLGVVLFLSLTILTYSKVPLIYAALCAFCELHRYRRIPFPFLMMALIAGAIVLTLIFMPAFSIYRGSGEFVLRMPSVDSFSLVLGEAASPFTIMHLALNGYVTVEDYPLWQSFVMWIPHAVWPDRPVDLAEGFAREVIANWQVGFGLGFSPFAEAYARLGLVGSSLFMAMVGGITAAMQSFFSRAVPKAMRAPAILTVGGYVSVLVLRGPFSSLITQSLQNWAPVIVVSLITIELVRRMEPMASRFGTRPADERALGLGESGR